MILLRKKGPLTFLSSYSKFLQDLPAHPDPILKVDSDGLYPRKVVNKTTKPQLRRKLLISSSKISPFGSCKNMVTRSINVSSIHQTSGSYTMRKQCKTRERNIQRIREHKSSAHIWWGMMPFPTSQTGKFYISQVLESSEKPCRSSAAKLVHLLLGSKALTNLYSILKGTDITLLTNVHTVKTMIFPVVIYGCESWTTKKAEHQRLDAFELRCWRRLLRVPWIARRLNQSILKEINPEYSSEGLMLKLKFQYFGHLMRRADSLEKILMLGKTEGKRRRGQQRMR